MITRSGPIRVLVVDDSAVVRRLVSDTLGRDPEIEVVGTATDPYAARDKILELAPDVLTLDIEMPRMDGITFLGIVMRDRPMPVIVMSSLSQRGSEHAMEALRLGAVDVLGKPAGPYSFGDLGPVLVNKIKAAAGVQVRPRPFVPPPPAPSREPRAPRGAPPVSADARRLILLGASTGGTEALREVLTRLPDGLPGIAIVQHIPATFSRAFAERLNGLCAFEVREAVDGDRLTPGLALVAPGDHHLVIRWAGDGYRVGVTGGPQVWHQRPAVDILFKSALESVGEHAIAGVLTGMGRDGAEGLLKLRERGAMTFAQDEATSVVYGMPRAAWENGGAARQLALDDIPDHLLRAVAQPAPSRRAPEVSHARR